MKLMIERWWPYGLAVAFSFGMWKAIGAFKDVDRLLDRIVPNSFTVAGILLGFFLTITTIIHAVPTNRMKFVKESGQFPRLVGFLNSAIYTNLVVLVVSFFVIAASSSLIPPAALPITLVIIAFAELTSIFVSIRFILIFTDLLHDG